MRWVPSQRGTTVEELLAVFADAVSALAPGLALGNVAFSFQTPAGLVDLGGLQPLVQSLAAHANGAEGCLVPQGAWQRQEDGSWLLSLTASPAHWCVLACAGAVSAVCEPGARWGALWDWLSASYSPEPALPGPAAPTSCTNSITGPIPAASPRLKATLGPITDAAARAGPPRRPQRPSRKPR